MKNKMKKNLMIDHEAKRIIMSGDFARKAANTESDEYKHLMSVKANHSDYAVERRTIKKKPNKESYKGLTYKYMEDHILKYDPVSMIEYKNLRHISECHSVRYPKIKKWFLEKYPDIAQYGMQEAIVTEAKRAA